MSPIESYGTLEEISVPRASGDEPELEDEALQFNECSPRERG